MNILTVIFCIVATSLITSKAATSGVFTYEPEGENIRITQVAEGITGHLEIPSHIDGKKVTHLGGGKAFGLNKSFPSSFTSITIPNTIEFIDKDTFTNSLITSVTIPPSVKHIGEFAFYASHIKSLTFLGNIETIETAVFHECLHLKTINFFPGMKSLGDSTFFTCPSLTHINLPRELESIEDRLFFNCANLVSVTMGPNVKEIHNQAFAECPKLTSVDLSWGLKSIKTAAFSTCNTIKSITIPPSVTDISSSAFQYCNSLQSIIFLGDAPTVIQKKINFFNPDGSFNLNPDGSFHSLHADLKIYFKEGKTGFTTPTWNNYPSAMIPASETPTKSWLRSHNLPEESNLDSDPNHDGVSLLAEYALRLNPAQNNSKAVPTIKFENNTAKITFFNGRSDIEYTPQHSTNLNNWSSTNLTMTQKSSGEMEASTPTTNNTGFFRIQIKQKNEQ